ncbi:M23 family metallopeptidase [Blastococcus mobilis]|uniref:M23 family metallopeptidase n=1 Tax=Blastococcus mobilis TaxID=1938746 RepID=UPI0015961DC2|nr:M23 family metallopeptidase [Blastococcus mobilis]
MITPLGAATLEGSKGLYRIPYADGTRVRVTRDAETHSPVRGRLDLVGVGGRGPHQVVAADAGRVVAIEDGNTVHSEQHCTRTYAPNNYVWIRHASGEWTKYSHLSPGSVRDDAGLSEGDVVERGTFLGYEDDIGCADGVHLHFEVAVPDDPADPFESAGGFIDGHNRAPAFCGDGVVDRTLVAGSTYTATTCRPTRTPGLPVLGDVTSPTRTTHGTTARGRRPGHPAAPSSR